MVGCLDLYFYTILSLMFVRKQWKGWHNLVYIIFFNFTKYILLFLFSWNFLLPSLVYFFLMFYLFIFRKRGRKGERGKKHQCVVASRAPPTRDLAHHSGMSPDWESNQWPLGLQCSIHWATSARVLSLVYSSNTFLYILQGSTQVLGSFWRFLWLSGSRSLFQAPLACVQPLSTYIIMSCLYVCLSC